MLSSFCVDLLSKCHLDFRPPGQGQSHVANKEAHVIVKELNFQFLSDLNRPSAAKRFVGDLISYFESDDDSNGRLKQCLSSSMRKGENRAVQSVIKMFLQVNQKFILS